MGSLRTQESLVPFKSESGYFELSAEGQFFYNSVHNIVCVTYLARIWLLFGVHPHVRQQFVLGVERRQLPGAILQHSRVDCYAVALLRF